jgi:chorismate synthase
MIAVIVDARTIGLTEHRDRAEAKLERRRDGTGLGTREGRRW